MRAVFLPIGGCTMARNVKVSAAVMNVRIHPHSKERYVEFFRAVHRLKRSAQVHGDRYGLISTANFSRANEGVVHGVITTFTRFERDGTWFDTTSLSEASDAKVAEVHIPTGLFPNAASYFFHFDASDHRMYVETYSRGKAITPPSVLRFLRNLMSDPAIVSEFGEPSISMVQTRAGLEPCSRSIE